MSAPPHANATPSFQGIQALRAIAALCVVAYHIAVTTHVRLGEAASSLLRNGAAGVDMFFVISGFVMVVSARRLEGRGDAAWRFASARLRRIVPLYWVCSAVKMIAVLAMPFLGKVKLTAGYCLGSLLFLPVHDGAGRFAPLLPVGWTLCFEMLFYALFAVALAARRPPALCVPPVLAAIVLLKWSGHGASDLGNPLVLEFAFGTTIAALWLRGWRLPRGLAWLVLAAAATLLAAVPGHALGSRVLSWGLPASAVVAATVSLEREIAPLLPKTLLALGAASYAIYLTHGFVLDAGDAAIAVMPQAMRGAAACLVLLVSSAAFGCLVHGVIEKPMLGKRSTAQPPVVSPAVLVLAGGGLSPVSGGVGTLMRNLLEAWAQSDAKGGAVPRIRIADTRGGGGRAHPWMCFVSSLCQVIFLCATRRVDLVHAHMTTRGSAARKGMLCAVAMALGVPVILHLHGADFIAFHRRLPAVLRRPLDAVLKRSRHVVAPGLYWRAFLEREAGVSPARISIVPNGVPPPHPCARVPDATPRLLFLGRLGARKGVADLISALAVPALREATWQATIAGDGNAAPYRAMLNWHGLNAKVSLPGWTGRAETAALLAQADILILPSYHEAMPIAVLEALAAGVAVITTPVGAIPEFLVHGQSALLVQPGATRDLADAILRLLNDPALRGRIAAAGHAVFCARLDITRTAAAIAGLYHGALMPAGGDFGSERAGGFAPSTPTRAKPPWTGISVTGGLGPLEHDLAICGQPPDEHARKNKNLERDASIDNDSIRSHPALGPGGVQGQNPWPSPVPHPVSPE